MKHEKAQNEEINALQGQIAILNEKLAGDSEAMKFTASVDDGFDYLAIGNSITLHPITDFWWGEWGMAASTPELDYYHLVTEDLENQYGSVNSARYNYYVWEIQAHDRTETYDFLDNWIVDGIDLITVQLSENASDLSTFHADFESLLRHIQEKCPSAEIVVIDDFWSDEKSRMKKSVCENMNISFADLSDIRGKSEYQAGMETKVHGTDGEEHIIEHSGVAAHPGDEGMRYIAEKVIEEIDMKQKQKA